MGRSKAKARRVRNGSAKGNVFRPFDATPERLAKIGEDDSQIVNPALIDSSEQPIGRTRRFRDSAVDRLHRRGALTYAQWYACDWYAKLHVAAFSLPRVVADYGRSHGGDGECNVGLPQSEAQLASRKLLLSVRCQLPPQMVRLFERVVIEDSMPPLGSGRAREQFVRRLAASAQAIADYIHAPGHRC